LFARPRKQRYLHPGVLGTGVFLYAEIEDLCEVTDQVDI